MSVLLSVVVPVCNNAAMLARSLRALTQSDLPRDLWELIIVDDGSTDDVLGVAATAADVIVRLVGRSHGPSYARNRGVEVARGPIVVFVDADMELRPDALRRFVWAFLRAPDVAAVYGSYDDEPAAPGLISQYRDLLSHHTHGRNAGEVDTFWADCGAVRRDAFLSVGMFNEWHFPRPQVEAAELGYRLRTRGYRIVLRPEIQGKHLKHWTLGAMVSADLKDRGVPRSRLMVGGRRPVLDDRERLSTLLIWLAIPALAVFVALHRPWLAAIAGILVGTTILLNFPLYRLFIRRRGVLFAIGTIPLQLLHHIVNGIAVVMGTALRHSVGDPQPSATVQAYAEVGVVKWPPVPRQVTGAPPPSPEPPAQEAGLSEKPT